MFRRCGMQLATLGELYSMAALQGGAMAQAVEARGVLGVRSLGTLCHATHALHDTSVRE